MSSSGLSGPGRTGHAGYRNGCVRRVVDRQVAAVDHRRPTAKHRIRTPGKQSLAKQGIKKRIARFTRRFRDPDAVRARAAALPTDNHTPIRIAELEAALERLSRGWEQHLPQLLDTVSIARDEARSANQVHDRLDAMRQDMDRLSERLDLNLMEMRRLISREKAPSDIRILSEESIARAVVDGLKLHFLRGDLPLAEFINVATEEGPGVDVLAVAGAALPFGEGLAREIVVARGYDLGGESAEVVFRNFWKLLVPGGKLRIDRFDLGVAPEAIARGDLKPQALSEIVGDNGRAPSSARPDIGALRELARSAGFTSLRVINDGAGGTSLRAIRPKASAGA